MSNATPEHDARCEAGADCGVESLGSCRCAERRVLSMSDADRTAFIEEFKEREGIDPTLLKMRVKRVRQAEAALAAVRRTLVTYVTDHAATACQWRDTRHLLVDPCFAPVDGVLMISCGHHAFLCARHGSEALRTYQQSVATVCTQRAEDVDLHEKPAVGVTVEWCGL